MNPRSYDDTVRCIKEIDFFLSRHIRNVWNEWKEGKILYFFLHSNQFSEHRAFTLFRTEFSFHSLPVLRLFSSFTVSSLIVLWNWWLYLVLSLGKKTFKNACRLKTTTMNGNQVTHFVARCRKHTFDTHFITKHPRRFFKTVLVKWRLLMMKIWSTYHQPKANLWPRCYYDYSSSLVTLSFQAINRCLLAPRNLGDRLNFLSKSYVQEPNFKGR